MADVTPASVDSSQGLEPFRPYLVLLASLQIQKFALAKPLLSKVDPEDLVQETLLRAWKFRDQYQGMSKGEQLAWLRQILTKVMISHLRTYLSDKRNIKLEISLDLDRTSRNLENLLGNQPNLTPSAQASKDEDIARLSKAILFLNSIGRTVILARHMEGLTFAQIGLRLGKSREAVTKIWSRALRELRENLGGFP